MHGVVGSIPTVSTKSQKTVVFHGFLFIQAAGLVYHLAKGEDIIKGGQPPLHLIMRQRASSLRLDNVHAYGVIGANILH